MNLRYTLPAEYEGVPGDEPIIYCIPHDLTVGGEYCSNGWLAVTEAAAYVLEDGRCLQKLMLSDTDKVSCVPGVDNGLLSFTMQGKETVLVRFSMRHMERHAYVARGITVLCEGGEGRVVSREREKHCPVCGHALPGTNLCPRCNGRGRTARRFLDLCGGYMLPLVCIMAFMLIISAISIVQQFVQRDFVDSVLVPAQGQSGDIARFFLVMLGLLALQLTLSVTRTLWSNRLATRISRDMRERVFVKINSLSLSFIDRRQTGELINRVVDDSGRIRQFMEDVFANMFTHLFTIAGAIVTMFFINWQMALLAVAFLPVAAVVIRLFRRHEQRLWRQQRRLDDRVNARLQDVISGIRVVKAFGKEQRETERFLSYTNRLTEVQIRNETFFATLYPFVTFILTMGSFFVMYMGGVQVLDPDSGFTPGQLTQMIAYASMLYGPLGFLTRLPRMLMLLTTAMERMYDILDEQSDIERAEQAKEVALRGEVAFENVSFGYNSYLPVLENVSFTARPGEMIGLVGASGSGKSTLINLLMRLYDVDDGRITVDGHDIRSLSPENLHGQIGVVLQETFLFSGTILDNIRFAKQNATREEIIHAAKMANAHEFITRFSDGYDTYVGEHGYNLSGGERQRIAIARAILHDPRLLILDEATSSLDTETEFQIQEAMRRLTKERTTFAIAHRLSTLREADRILVLSGHRIAEMGTHNELMRQKGIYYGLVMAQLDMHSVKKVIGKLYAFRL